MSVITLLVCVAVVAFQGLGGGLWWWSLRRRQASAVEVLGMGLAIGTIASMLASVVLHSTPIGPIAWALPTIASIGAWFAVRRRLPSSPSATPQRRGEVRAVVLGSFLGLIPLIINWRRIPLGSVTDSSFLDIYFLQAISTGLARFGGGESILMTGGSLRYHWFAYAWVGDIDRIANLPNFAGLTRILPLVALVGVSAIAARWASQLAEGQRFAHWAPTVATVLIVGGGYTGALYGSILNFDSPSQSLTTLWLLGLLFATVTFLTSETRWFLMPIAILASASTGGKVSHIAVAAGGMLTLTGVGVFTRKPWAGRSTLVLVVSGATALATYAMVIRGAAIDRNLVEEVAVKASTWQGLDPLPGMWGVLAGTIALLLAALARLAGLAWLIRDRSWWTNPSMLLSAGGLGVAVVALFALRDGINETWFFLAASAAGAVLSAVGVTGALGYLHGRLGRVGIVQAFIVAILVALPSLVLSANLYSDNSRSFAHWSAAWLPWVIAITIGAIASFKAAREVRLQILAAFAVVALVSSSVLTRPSVWWTAQRQVTTEGDRVSPDAFSPPSRALSSSPQSGLSRADLAANLGALASPTDVVLTTNPRSSLIPAYAGLRMYLAGERYQFGLGAAGDVTQIRHRQTTITQIVDDPDLVADILCPESIAWLWWESEVPDSLQDFVILEGAQASVISLQPVCNYRE